MNYSVRSVINIRIDAFHPAGEVQSLLHVSMGDKRLYVANPARAAHPDIKNHDPGGLHSIQGSPRSLFRKSIGLSLRIEKGVSHQSLLLTLRYVTDRDPRNTNGHSIVRWRTAKNDHVPVA